MCLASVVTRALVVDGMRLVWDGIQGCLWCRLSGGPEQDEKSFPPSSPPTLHKRAENKLEIVDVTVT